MLTYFSYMEDKNIFAFCTENRDYELVSQYIESNKSEFTYYIEQNGSLFGYDIKKVEQLSEIYGFDCFSVNFFFDNIFHHYDEEQNKLIKTMMHELNKTISEKNGYYIIKVPSFNSMLLEQLNKYFIDRKLLFAGGTVCYYTTKNNDEQLKNDELIIELASHEDKTRFKEDLIALSEESFSNFFGQYHISHVTREKAPLIYKNWIKDYIGIDKTKKLIIARYGEKMVGFLAFDETKYTYEIVLNTVKEGYRGLKIYEHMLKKCVDYCLDNNKLITISTQLDNFFPQRSWINHKFKPFNSFYLFHYNNLDEIKY